MRTLRSVWLVIAGASLLLPACGQSTQSPAAPALSHLPSSADYSFQSGAESLVAMFDLQIDAVGLTATATPVASRQGQAQPPQALSFDLDIANFLRPNSFEVVGITRDVDGDLELSFIHRHPFPAPNFANPISGQNRADLGYTGRLMILAEESSSTFYSNSVRLDPTLIKDADGYFNTGDLLATQGLTNNTFPYVLLADDGEDNRIGDSNGGSPTGSYAPAAGGWQRSNAGANNTGWTGYDYLHGGQQVRNTFTLRTAAIGSGIDLRVAVLIKYTDPRGQGGRTLRFPPVTADVTQFAYRLPYSALDCSQALLTSGPVTIDAGTGAVAAVTAQVRDWDSGATAAADANLSDESNVELVEPGAPGAPVVELEAAVLAAGAITLTQTGSNSGRPGDELVFDGALVNALGSAAAGDYYGLLRVTDPSNSVNDDAYHFGVDPVTIQANPARALPPITYQVVPITVELGIQPPVITGVTPLFGAPSSTVTFSATTTGDPATSWSWDFGTWGSPTSSTAEQPMVTVPAVNGSYDGSVTATNAGGSSAPFNFTFTVSPPWPPAPTPVDPGGGTQSLGWYPAITTYDGKPVIAAFDMSGGNSILKIYAANIPEPLLSTDWTKYAIPATQYPGSAGDTGISMLTFNNRLVVGYKDDNVDDLKIAIATVTTPTLPGATDWAVHTIDSVNDVGRDSRLVDHNGLLAVSYWAAPPDDDLKVAQALVAVPASASDWAIHTVDGIGGINTGTWTGLVSFDDGVSGPRLWASCRMFVAPNRARVSRATVLTPASSSDWIHMDVDPGSASGRWTSLTQCTIAGQPRVAVSYCDFNGSTLDVAISTTSTPTTSVDWLVINNINTVPMISPGAWGTDIKEIQGRLTIVWNNNISPNDTLVIARATTDNPTLPSHFTLETAAATPGVDTGFYPRMTLLSSGNVGIAYRHEPNFVGFPGSLHYISRLYSY